MFPLPRLVYTARGSILVLIFRITQFIRGRLFHPLTSFTLHDCCSSRSSRSSWISNLFLVFYSHNPSGSGRAALSDMHCRAFRANVHNRMVFQFSFLVSLNRSASKLNAEKDRCMGCLLV